jgi:hypothetical protein
MMAETVRDLLRFRVTRRDQVGIVHAGEFALLTIAGSSRR